MNFDDAGPARLVRQVDGRWQTIGDLLPPLADDDMHAETAAEVVYWTLPAAADAARGDRLICREQAWTLTDRCGPNHPATRRLAEHVYDNYAATWAADWLTRRQVWALRPIRGTVGHFGR